MKHIFIFNTIALVVMIITANLQIQISDEIFLNVHIMKSLSNANYNYPQAVILMHCLIVFREFLNYVTSC